MSTYRAIDHEDWHRECFPSEEEAIAFSTGLTWGDGGTWTVDAIERCQYPQEGWAEEWGVIFIRTELLPK